MTRQIDNICIDFLNADEIIDIIIFSRNFKDYFDQTKIFLKLYL